MGIHDLLKQDGTPQKIKFGVTDIDGVLRGKIMDASKLKGSAEIGFCNVIFGWDINDTVYSNTATTSSSGFRDETATVDLATGRSLAWDDDIPFFLGDFRHASGISNAACPRSLLVQILEKFQALDFQVKVGPEYEWFNFRDSPQSVADKHHQNLDPITPGMFGYSLLRLGSSALATDIFEQLHASDIPIEGLHTETGPGAYEACIRYGDALQAADRAILFKLGVKCIAAKHGVIPSFMAKWTPDLPGCSGHIHQSLWRGDQNLFWEKNGTQHMSPLMQYYVAGQLHCLPYIVPMFAPFINSYKRFVEGSWAPTSASWAVENRTVPLRVIPTNAKAIRLETRLAGADANPYLAIASCLAAGLYGIENKLALPAAVKGDAYQKRDLIPLPTTLRQAIDMMRESPLPKLLFGESFVDHFIQTRQWECDQFDKAVTDWELQRYFEIV